MAIRASIIEPQRMFESHEWLDSVAPPDREFGDPDTEFAVGDEILVRFEDEESGQERTAKFLGYGTAGNKEGVQWDAAGAYGVGVGHNFYLVRLDTLALVASLAWPSGHFGHLYLAPDRSLLLVCSESSMTALEPSGATRWVAQGLGEDGVVVKRTSADRILGEGAWDPPSSWRPFELDFKTGKRLT